MSKNSITAAGIKVFVDNQTKTGIAGVVGDVSKMTSRLTKNITKGMAQGVGQALTHGVGGLLGGAWDKLFEPFDRSDVIGNLKEATGLSSELLSSLEYGAKAAGTDFEGVTKGLTEFTDKLSQARAGNKDAQKVFDVLGGIDYKQGNPEDVLMQTVEALSSVQDEFDRTSLAMQLFGSKSAKALLPLIKDGSAGLASLVADMSKLGVTLSATDLERLAKADDAMDRLKAALDGIITRIAVEGAPVLEQFAGILGDAIPEIIPTIKSMGDEFRKATAVILENVASIVDALDEFKQKAGMTADALNNAVTGGAHEGDTAGTRIKKFFLPPKGGYTANLLGIPDSAYENSPDAEVVPQAKKTTSAFGDELRKRAALIKETTSAVVKDQAYWDKMWDKADAGPDTSKRTRAVMELTAAINEQVEGIQKQIDTFGMSHDEIARWELKQKGATDAMLENLKKKQGELAMLKPAEPLKMSNADFAGSQEASNFVLQYRMQGENVMEKLADKTEKNTAKAVEKLEIIASALKGDEELGVV